MKWTKRIGTPTESTFVHVAVSFPTSTASCLRFSTRTACSRNIRSSYLKKSRFFGITGFFWETIPPLHIFFFSFWVWEPKSRERSVKHKQHKIDGKSHGKWTILGGIFRERHHFKIPVFPFQNGKFKNFGRNFGYL